MRTRRSSVQARALPPAIAAFAMLMAFSGPADAQRQDRQGKEVVDAVCSACHATGKDNAPRIGDTKAWAPRASQGLTALTSNALAGIRKMPPHGGSAGVSDVEIQRAIIYMVNQSGGQWVEPLVASGRGVARSSESVVQSQCAVCHREGKDGAPKIGDRAAWTQRLAKGGLDALVASAVHGYGPMPPRGGISDLSSQDIRDAILYMFLDGLPPAPPAPPVAAVDPHHKLVAGTDVYFGVMPAETLRAQAKDGVKRTATIPVGKVYYHVNISLADNQTQAPVKDAQVTMRVSDGMTTQTKTLTPVVANDAVSYGNYFRFDAGSAYVITAEFKRPNVPGTNQAKFEFRAP